MNIITDLKKLNTAITRFGTKLKNIDSESHLLAVSSVHHALENSNNWEPLSKLVKAVGGYDEGTKKFKSRAVRAKDMRNWVSAHLPVRWDDGKYKTDKKKMAAFNKESCLESINTPWYEKIKDEGAPVKFTPVGTRIANVVKAIQKDIKNYQELSEEEQVACDFDTKVNDKAIQQLMQVINIESLIITEQPANEADTIAALEAVVAADQAKAS